MYSNTQNITMNGLYDVKTTSDVPHFMFLDNDKIPRYGASFVYKYGGKL